MASNDPPPQPLHLRKVRIVNDSKRVRRIDDRGEEFYHQHHQQTYAERKNLTSVDGPKDIITEVAKTLVNAALPFAAEQSTDFMPRTLFESILTLGVVFQIVGKLDCYKGKTKEECIRLAKEIYYGGSTRPPCKRLLATLVVLGGDSAHNIKTFMAQGMNDQCLPLLVENSSNKHLLHCRFQPQGHHHPLINSTGDNPKKWRQDFTKWSRAVMSPYIIWEERGLHCHYIMRGGGPLPMAPCTSGKRKQPRSGGFGKVYKVELHDGDRSFGHSQGDNSHIFALKELIEKEDESDADDLSTSAGEFDLEIQSLIFAESRAQKVPGPEDTETKNHLIQLLASFEVYNSLSNPDHPTYYMLFPWADGDLEEFWKQEDDNYLLPRNKEHIGWIIDQFYYLAKALQCVHNDRQHILSGRTDSNRYGRHGDIKPKNFLFFRDRSGEQGPGLGLRIVMADFGLGRLHSKESRSKQTPGHVRKWTESYAGPEFELSTISPKSDIFSLGCVFLEFIVWLFKKFNGVQHFQEARREEAEPPTSPYPGWKLDRFWKSPDAESAVLKDCVKKEFDELKNRDDCVEAVGDILELIESHMLHIDKDQRSDSQTLVNKLESIRRRWKRQDSLYGTRSWKKSILSRKSTASTTAGDEARGDSYARLDTTIGVTVPTRRNSPEQTSTNLKDSAGNPNSRLTSSKPLVRSRTLSLVVKGTQGGDSGDAIPVASRDPRDDRGERVQQAFRQPLTRRVDTTSSVKSELGESLKKLPMVWRILTQAWRRMRSMVERALQLILARKDRFPGGDERESLIAHMYVPAGT